MGLMWASNENTDARYQYYPVGTLCNSCTMCSLRLSPVFAVYVLNIFRNTVKR